jgi:hypothetical protein
VTERKGEVRPPLAETGIGAEIVVHKATRDCLMTEPHRRDICGIVAARALAAREADDRRRGAPPA